MPTNPTPRTWGIQLGNHCSPSSGSAIRFHEALAKWVRGGGALVVVDDDRDPYNAVREWWNTAPHSYKSPREHLFDALGIPKEAVGLHKVGRGIVLRESDSPAALTYKADGAETIRKVVRQAANAVKLPWKETSTLLLRRGPYLIAAGLDESLPAAKPYVLRGRYLNLFEPSLAVHDDVVVSPGSRMLLLDLGSRKAPGPKVVAAACRVRNENTDGQTLRFQVDASAIPTQLSSSQRERRPRGCCPEGSRWNPRNTISHGASCACAFPTRSSRKWL